MLKIDRGFVVLSLEQFVLLANRVGWLSRLSGTRDLVSRWR